MRYWNPIYIVRDVYRHNALLKQAALREIRTSYRGSILGIGWAVIVPIVRMAIYTFVFGFIFKGRFTSDGSEGAIEYALGIFLGLTVFQVVADGFGIGPSVILNNANLVKKVVFPLELLPVAAASVSIFNFLIGILLTFIALLVLGIGVSVTQLWYPVIAFPILMLSLGLYWVFSGLGVFLRDIGQMTQLLSMLLLFGSAVFYPVSSIPE